MKKPKLNLIYVNIFCYIYKHPNMDLQHPHHCISIGPSACAIHSYSAALGSHTRTTKERQVVIGEQLYLSKEYPIESERQHMLNSCIYSCFYNSEWQAIMMKELGVDDYNRMMSWINTYVHE
jgi:hypothetical protein